MSEHPDKEKWIEIATKEMRGKPLETLDWMTPEGIQVKPLYSAEDIEGMAHVNTLPGLAPYVRGPKATMYAGRPWTIRQYAGFSTAKESTHFTEGALRPGRKAFPLLLILPPIEGMTPIIPGSSAISARQALRWIPSRI